MIIYAKRMDFKFNFFYLYTKHDQKVSIENFNVFIQNISSLNQNEQGLEYKRSIDELVSIWKKYEACLDRFSIENLLAKHMCSNWNSYQIQLRVTFFFFLKLKIHLKGKIWRHGEH